MERKRHPGLLFNANRTPEGCEDNLDSSDSAEEGSFARFQVSVIRQVVTALSGEVS